MNEGAQALPYGPSHPAGNRSHLRGITTTPTHSALERLLTVHEWSDYPGIPVATLYDWLVDGVGPKAVERSVYQRATAGLCVAAVVLETGKRKVPYGKTERQALAQRHT